MMEIQKQIVKKESGAQKEIIEFLNAGKSQNRWGYLVSSFIETSRRGGSILEAANWIILARPKGYDKLAEIEKKYGIEEFERALIVVVQKQQFEDAFQILYRKDENGLMVRR